MSFLGNIFRRLNKKSAPLASESEHVESKTAGRQVQLEEPEHAKHPDDVGPMVAMAPILSKDTKLLKKRYQQMINQAEIFFPTAFAKDESGQMSIEDVIHTTVFLHRISMACLADKKTHGLAKLGIEISKDFTIADFITDKLPELFLQHWQYLFKRIQQLSRAEALGHSSAKMQRAELLTKLSLLIPIAGKIADCIKDPDERNKFISAYLHQYDFSAARSETVGQYITDTMILQLQNIKKIDDPIFFRKRITGLIELIENHQCSYTALKNSYSGDKRMANLAFLIENELPDTARRALETSCASKDVDAINKTCRALIAAIGLSFRRSGEVIPFAITGTNIENASAKYQRVTKQVSSILKACSMLIADKSQHDNVAQLLYELRYKVLDSLCREYNREKVCAKANPEVAAAINTAFAQLKDFCLAHSAKFNPEMQRRFSNFIVDPVFYSATEIAENRQALMERARKVAITAEIQAEIKASPSGEAGVQQQIDAADPEVEPIAYRM